MVKPGFDRGKPRRPDQFRTRVNHHIKVPEVRLIDEEGNAVGIISTGEALRMAVDKGLDLVEVSPSAKPPVCRIIDYGKYKYEQKQREKAAKKRAAKSIIKELKFRPKIGKHDIDVRVSHARKFLLKNFKVRMIVRFRGREHSHPQIAEEILKKVYERLSDIGDMETSPKKEGAIMIMNIAPNSQKIQIYKKGLELSSKNIEEEIDDDILDDIDDIDDDDELLEKDEDISEDGDFEENEKEISDLE